MKILTIIIYLSIGFVLCLASISLFSFGVNWQIIGVIVLILTAGAIIYQAQYTRMVAEFSVMPKFAFTVKSGKTVYKKENLNLTEELFTRIFIKNFSNFPISFWLKVELFLEYKNGKDPLALGTHDFTKGQKYGWVLMPGNVSFPVTKDILPKAILGKTQDKLTPEDREVLNSKREQIGSVIARFKISSSPLLKKGINFELKPLEWRFNLEEMVWTDPQGARDYDISF